MHPLDTAIVAVYLAGVFLVGSLLFRGQTSLADYFLGSRRMPWWAAAFSGIATILGAVSFLGAPGQAFKSDLRFLQYRLGSPIAIVLIGWVMLPLFYRLQVFSIYEYLERRFDLRTRLVGGLQFFLLKLLYLGISIYAPALLFVEMTGLPLIGIVLGIGLFVTVYTTIGGVKAVIWTDTLQLFILLAGLATTAVVITRRAGGWDHVMTAASAAGKLRLFDASLDFATEFTMLGGVLGGAFVLLSQYGVNQAELQKMLTTASIPRARLALISTMVCATAVGVIYFLTGAGLFVFYAQNPDKGAQSLAPDRIFAKFILEELPTGLRGLLLAAVCSAAMSAASSVLNSLTTVATSDLFGRLTHRTVTIKTARWLTVAIGITATLLALWVDRMGNVLVLSTKLQNFFGGSLTGAFLLGMTVPRATATGGFWGLVTGTVAVGMLAQFTSVSWLWHGIFAATVTYVSGIALSLISAKGAVTQHA